MNYEEWNALFPFVQAIQKANGTVQDLDDYDDYEASVSSNVEIESLEDRIRELEAERETLRRCDCGGSGFFPCKKDGTSEVVEIPCEKCNLGTAVAEKNYADFQKIKTPVFPNDHFYCLGDFDKAVQRIFPLLGRLNLTNCHGHGLIDRKELVSEVKRRLHYAFYCRGAFAGPDAYPPGEWFRILTVVQNRIEVLHAEFTKEDQDAEAAMALLKSRKSRR